LIVARPETWSVINVAIRAAIKYHDVASITTVTATLRNPITG
jgi:hypothetical protein